MFEGWPTLEQISYWPYCKQNANTFFLIEDI